MTGLVRPTPPGGPDPARRDRPASPSEPTSAPHAGLDGLVVEDQVAGTFRVARRTMVDQDVLDAERRCIFDRSWLYVGHESEVPGAGDFRCRQVGGRPLVLVRGADERIRVLYNTCSHRGARVVRQDEGSARHFECFYHAWTYDSTGALARVPGEDAYPETWSKDALGLRSPSQVDAYRGLVFVAFDAGAPPLVDYLGSAAPWLDLVLDQFAGGMRVLPGSYTSTVRANWKLLVENTCDSYHLRSLHATYFAYVRGQGGGPSRQRPPGRTVDLGGGHHAVEAPEQTHRPVARWAPIFGEDARHDMAEVRARLVGRFGEERAYRIADTLKNVVVFPSLMVVDAVSTVLRVVEPLSPGESRVTTWAVAGASETDEQVERRLGPFLLFQGPGGFASPDDIEAVESCQMGFAAGEVAWSDLSKGLGRANPDVADEDAQRTFWRHWQRCLAEEPRGRLASHQNAPVE